jgi:hypothetical protein
MSAKRSVPFAPAPRPAVEPSGRRRPSTLCTLAIYLAAFTVPGIGSTLAWAGAYAWTRDPALAAHHRRALRLQLPCLVAIVSVQLAVLVALGLGFPWGAPTELRRVLVFVGLHLTAGVYLAMGLAGPIGLVAARGAASVPPAPAPARVRPRSMAPAPTRKVASG